MKKALGFFIFALAISAPARAQDETQQGRDDKTKRLLEIAKDAKPINVPAAIKKINRVDLSPTDQSALNTFLGSMDANSKDQGDADSYGKNSIVPDNFQSIFPSGQPDEMNMDAEKFGQIRRQFQAPSNLDGHGQVAAPEGTQSVEDFQKKYVDGSAYQGIGSLIQVLPAAAKDAYRAGRFRCYGGVKCALMRAGCLPIEALRVNNQNLTYSAIDFTKLASGNLRPYFERLPVLGSPQNYPPGAVLVYGDKNGNCEGQGTPGSRDAESGLHGHIEVRGTSGFWHDRYSANGSGRKLCSAFMPTQCGTHAKLNNCY